MTSVLVREARNPTRCAVCHGGLESINSTCGKCFTVFHSDCNGGKCPSLGCASETPVKAIQVKGKTTWLNDLREGIRGLSVAFALMLIAVLAVACLLAIGYSAYILVPLLFTLDVIPIFICIGTTATFAFTNFSMLLSAKARLMDEDR